MARKLLLNYFHIAASIMVIYTILAVIDNYRNSNTSIIEYLGLKSIVTLLFVFCFINMFMLPIAGITLLLKKHNIFSAIFFILAALLFLFFFMGLENWDRF